MKTPDPTKAESSVTRQGAQIIAAGGFPAKQNTVTADVLARLLAGERLTSLDTVYEASTTRLGAVVFYLANNYGWQIQSIDNGWRQLPWPLGDNYPGRWKTGNEWVSGSVWLSGIRSPLKMAVWQAKRVRP